MIEGVRLIEDMVYCDQRGSFLELGRARATTWDKHESEWAQWNVSTSRDGVLRGLHIQRVNPQAKLVRCLSGVIFDVGVDLRRNSKTFKKWTSYKLELGQSVYWPAGIAHGFMVTEGPAIVHYATSERFHADSDGGVRWNDPELEIRWPWLASGNPAPTMSEKDRNLPTVREWLEGKNKCTYLSAS